MRVHGWSVWVVLAVSACGGSSQKPPATAKQDPTPPPARAAVEQPPDHGVAVKGIEGTLSAYDVRDTMNHRLEPLAACQQERIRRVRHLSGDIELAIHVLSDGNVSQVDVVKSDLGDIETERCIAKVVHDTRFPKPHGGEADVKWNLTLEPHRTRPPEAYEEERLEEPLELKLPDLAEACEMTRRSPRLAVTAYVAPSGKVVAAGAASKALGQDALLACASAEVQSWQLPRSRRLSKAQFTARYRAPLNDAQRKAIRKKHARRRKAEQKRERAEAKRRKRRARQKRAREKAQRAAR